MDDNITPFDYIKKRFASMESNRGTWEDHWQEILDYVMPRKADVTTINSKGSIVLKYKFKEIPLTANISSNASIIKC